MAASESDGRPASRLVPVLPLRETCLFPTASLTVVLDEPAATAALALAQRTGGPLLALARREGGGPRDLHEVGTLALAHPCDPAAPLESRVVVEGLSRARADQLFGTEGLVAEIVPVEDGDEGDEWESAVEALARYLHAHPQLRAFLERQRRSNAPMAWVNLACQHLPVSPAARQSLLEASAAQRCARIARGLDALLRKEQLV
jgi:Lon protease-like protein